MQGVNALYLSVKTDRTEITEAPDFEIAIGAENFQTKRSGR
jgi:hypothetical protein